MESDAERPSDQQILDFQKTLAAEFLAAPLVAAAAGFDGLLAEVAGGAAALAAKAAQLAQRAAAMRRVRKDGNCFFRALAFALCEALLARRGSAWAAAVAARIRATRETLVAAGYDPIITDDFFEPLADVVADSFTAEKLNETIEKEYISDTIVCYLRLVTAAELKKNRDLYEAFILDSYPTLDEFIAHQVEPMGVESDQIHIVAMANALGVTFNVANLDASDTTDLNFHDIAPMFPLELEGNDAASQPVIHLLYRPGHYDIVYMK
ncbi:peptidase C65 Otubain-domain-containing protein [Obelidium mucronatum]|nr:peptidase C65 Otubain-domain-containing protein [Obelidium mucronatum]